MSVFGGDSWAREAQFRKRRVDDLLVEGLHGSSFKKLASGKYACLVCPNNPVLDSLLMLSTHNKGSRHLASESRMKERELMKQNEINKRIALSDSYTHTAKSSSCNQKPGLTDKPLIEQTKKTVLEMLSNRSQQQMQDRSKKEQSITGHIASACESTESYLSPWKAEADKAVSQQHLDFQEHRERELKFTAAGWKRDGNGKWYRDENVEFDSDEEDPNVCLG